MMLESCNCEENLSRIMEWMSIKEKCFSGAAIQWRVHTWVAFRLSSAWGKLLFLYYVSDSVFRRWDETRLNRILVLLHEYVDTRMWSFADTSGLTRSRDRAESEIVFWNQIRAIDLKYFSIQFPSFESSELRMSRHWVREYNTDSRWSHADFNKLGTFIDTQLRCLIRITP